MRAVEPRSSLKRRSKLLALTALGVAFLAAGVLPLTLLAIPNPPQYQGVSVMAERGAYVLDEGQLYRLYPHPAAEDGFPEETVKVGSAAQIRVRSRQYDEIGRYRLMEYASRQAVPLEPVMDDSRILRLAPRQPLAPGLYEFASVKDSMYGEEEFYYFEVSASGGDEPNDGSASVPAPAIASAERAR